MSAPQRLRMMARASGRVGTRVARPLAMNAIDYQREVSPLWLAERTQHPLRVVDIREPFQMLGETGHVPGAVSIPLPHLAEAAARWPRDLAIAIVDDDGQQAARAALMLVNLGFIDVVWMTGGMRAWHAAGFPVAFAPEADAEHTEAATAHLRNQ